MDGDQRDANGAVDVDDLALTAGGYMPPRFGAYRLGRLPAGEIENWLNDEIAAGLAPSSVHRHYRTLRRLLQVAVGDGSDLAEHVERFASPGLDALVFFGLQACTRAMVREANVTTCTAKSHAAGASVRRRQGACGVEASTWH